MDAQEQQMKTYGVFLTPLIGMVDICSDARYYGAGPAELDGTVRINMFFKDIKGTSLQLDDSFRAFMEDSSYYQDRIELIGQPYTVFSYSVPPEYEQDLYYFCAAQLDKMSDLAKNKIREFYPTVVFDPADITQE